MWFWLSIAALICWSGSDLFSKIGCSDPSDKRSHLKMVTAVGMVMGLHAAYEIFIGKTEISFDIILTYLPVSLLYIGSMALGYISLRYIELSVSSPICNSSGALVAIMCLITGGIGQTSTGQLIATAIICIGVVGLGFAEAYEDEEKRAARQQKGNRKYSKSALAIILPLAYCILDAAGTFADSLVLEKLSEDSANVAYELTFFTAGICTLIYTLIIKERKACTEAHAAQIRRRGLRNGGTVCIHLRHRRQRARNACGTDNFGILRGVGSMVTHFPEGKKCHGSTTLRLQSQSSALLLWVFSIFREKDMAKTPEKTNVMRLFRQCGSKLYSSFLSEQRRCIRRRCSRCAGRKKQTVFSKHWLLSQRQE